ncbi:UNVERIFIED_CONTAM: hypothetical protein PYX00_008948 [Menopon gallinae]|uniref:Uncharacterized protein n=1 Tax=Menopon gallinae TaxID=328185 RepID=A0AAW2H994_9NEOP
MARSPAICCKLPGVASRVSAKAFTLLNHPCRGVVPPSPGSPIVLVLTNVLGDSLETRAKPRSMDISMWRSSGST